MATRVSRCLTGAPLFFALCLAVSSSAFGQNPEDDIETKRRDLTDMEKQVSGLQQELDAHQGSRTALIVELEGYERDIAQLARAGRQLDGMIDEQTATLRELQMRLEVERKALESERGALAGLLRSAYALSGGEGIRLLLDQEDMMRLGRVLSYYGYLNRYRVGRIQAIAARALRLDDLRLDVAEETQRLAMLAGKQDDTRQRLAVAQQQRLGLLEELERTIASHAENLSALQADAHRLRSLVEQLERRIMALPEADVSQEPIAKLRGRLSWPLDGGRLVRRFGRPKGDTGQRWDGVIIAAAEGTEVHALHHGRIAYADWLRGFGLLMIIEHDDGYLTLYGHNQTLLKEPGEWVSPGDVIALSGASGGSFSSGLYFAIRHRGRPVDPERWCGSMPGSGASRSPGDTDFHEVAERGRDLPIQSREPVPSEARLATVRIPETGTNSAVNSL